MLDEAVEVVSNGGHGSNAEGGQEQLPDDFHSKGHAVVLGKVDVAPIGHPDALMPVHVGLDPHLYNLVNKEHREDCSACNPPFCPETARHAHFFPLCLASMLKVAWGTARRRSAGISFPVSRQMPYVLFSIRTKAAFKPLMNLS